MQVVRGRVSDAEQLWTLRIQLGHDLLEEWRAFRPDVLGNLTIVNPDGRFTIVIYFTSETEARAAEQKEPPPRAKANREQMRNLWVGEPEFLTLTEPWLHVQP